ncbi:MFS transporter [Bradyrhizobium sp. Arg237L]|uniref:MFS transporter n=1 Tax=Bradyrhizobium sp. Arg237L TaxID=3003352 RepID=UPI00249DEB02|nr:MFS transporter [Bradyrhizobium sp. Arg237L]MDI4234171.1 MFS transporter [Bradyrhizobium sp. Arg237L]
MKNRWLALVFIFVVFLQFPLNWFAVVPAFGGIVGEMKITFAEVGVIVGMFIAGYGLAHVPGGWLAEKYGMRTAMIVGVLVETAGAALTAWAPNYEILLAARFLCGVGGSIFAGTSFGLTAAWFRGKELALANGILQGGAFTIGAAIGLFGLAPVVAAVGWRNGVMIGAGVGLLTLVLVIAFFTAPQSESGDVLEGNHLSKESLRRVFGNPVLWIMGAAILGAYGSYFSAAQLLPSYAEKSLHVDSSASGTIGLVLLLAGIPGGIIGGWLTDRVLGVLGTFLAACIVEAIAFLLIPHLGLFGLEVAAAAIGITLIAAFVPWVSIPGEPDSGFHISDVPTAVGLMLSIAAIGGAAIPPLFSKIAGVWDFDTAWRFQGALTLGFALLALLANHRRTVNVTEALVARS